METMMTAIIVAGITGIFSVVATVVTGRFNNKKVIQDIKATSELSDTKIEDKLDKFQALTDMKIEQLAKTTDIKIKQLADETRMHNNFAQKIPVIEQRLNSQEQRISALEGQNGK